MSARVKLPPILQEFSGGIEAPRVSGNTIGECLNNLEEQFPGIKEYLFDRRGRLLRIFGIYLDSDGLNPVELDTPVRENDEIVILNFLMGG
jgi:molybdopterin synthase sulfur carrier subunit